MNTKSLWLVGAGPMARDYARVLQAIEQPFTVAGRGESSAAAFERETGCEVISGGLASALENESAPESAIVAVGVDQLAPVAEVLIRAGVRRILLEKPGGLDLAEITALDQSAKDHGALVLLAYNRRFYNSVQQVRHCVAEDGGLLSVQFEFTEWAHKIDPLAKAPGVKEHWVLGNSSHVIDLAFHLCGRPSDWRCWHAGSLDWHPAAARFSGAGLTEQGIMFSYLSDWQAPGRWGLELMTAKRRLILRPMEQLQVTPLGSVKIEAMTSENALDQQFKPGLYRQTEAFLQQDDTWFCTLSEQVINVKLYSKMAGYL